MFAGSGISKVVMVASGAFAFASLLLSAHDGLTYRMATISSTESSSEGKDESSSKSPDKASAHIQQVKLTQVVEPELALSAYERSEVFTFEYVVADTSATTGFSTVANPTKRQRQKSKYTASSPALSQADYSQKVSQHSSSPISELTIGKEKTVVSRATFANQSDMEQESDFAKLAAAISHIESLVTSAGPGSAERVYDANPAAGKMESGDQHLVAFGQYTSVQSLHTPQPDYPRVAVRKMLEADVHVSFTVNVHGQVEQVQFDGQPNRYFARAIRQILSEWRYQPATVNGKKVNAVQTETFSFTEPEKRLLYITGSRFPKVLKDRYLSKNYAT